MRLYTILKNDKEEVAVSFREEDQKCYVLSENGFAFADMNQLIDEYTDDVAKKIYALNNNGRKNLLKK